MSDTSDNKKKLIEALDKCHGIVADACKMAGLTRDTFYRYKKKDGKFKTAIDAIQDATLDYVESKLFNLIEKNNPAAIFFYLKTIGQTRGYIERQYIDHTNKGEKFDFDNTNTDELLSRIGKLLSAKKPEEQG